MFVEVPLNKARVAMGFTVQLANYERPTWQSGPIWKHLGLALGSPIFPSGCEGKLGVALESLQGLSPALPSF